MNNYRSNIWKYYVFCFLDMFTVFLPFIIFYFQDLGFSLTEIMIMNGSFAVVVFFFEIPSGYLADRIGRKNSMLIAVMFQIMSMIVLYTAESFVLLIVSHMFLGFSWSFLSGADSALMYDTLLSFGKEKQYKRIFGKARFFGEIGVIMAVIIGSLIINYGFKLTIILTIISHSLLLPLVLSMNEPKVHKKIAKQPFNNELLSLVSVVKVSLQKKKLLMLFLYSFVVLGFMNTMLMIYQPYFRATSMPLHMFGWIFALLSIPSAIGSFMAHDFEKWFGMKGTMILMPTLIMISFLLGGILFIKIGFVFFMFRELARGLIYPVMSDYVNKETESRYRATVLSVGGMFSRLGYFFISVLIGFIADITSLRFAMITAAVLMVAFIVLLVVNINRNSNPSTS